MITAPLLPNIKQNTSKKNSANEIEKNKQAAIVLLFLIIANYIVAELAPSYSFIILPVTFVKFLSVLFQFVEVKHAHILWKVVSILFIAAYIILLMIFQFLYR